MPGKPKPFARQLPGLINTLAGDVRDLALLLGKKPQRSIIPCRVQPHADTEGATDKRCNISPGTPDQPMRGPSKSSDRHRHDGSGAATTSTHDSMRKGREATTSRRPPLCDDSSDDGAEDESSSGRSSVPEKMPSKAKRCLNMSSSSFKGSDEESDGEGGDDGTLREEELKLELEKSRQKSRRLQALLAEASLEGAKKNAELERRLKGMEKVMDSEREGLLKELDELRIANHALLDETVEQHLKTASAAVIPVPAHVSASGSAHEQQEKVMSVSKGDNEVSRMQVELASQRKISENLMQKLQVAKEMIAQHQVTEGGGWRNVKGQWSRHQQGSASDPLEDSAFLGGATTSESNAASEGLSLTDLSHNGQRQGKATQRDTQMAPQSLEEGSNVEDARELRRQLSDLKEQLSSERKVSERLTKQLAVARMMLYAQAAEARRFRKQVEGLWGKHGPQLQAIVSNSTLLEDKVKLLQHELEQARAQARSTGAQGRQQAVQPVVLHGRQQEGNMTHSPIPFKSITEFEAQQGKSEVNLDETPAGSVLDMTHQKAQEDAMTTSELRLQLAEAQEALCVQHAYRQWRARVVEQRSLRQAQLSGSSLGQTLVRASMDSLTEAIEAVTLTFLGRKKELEMRSQLSKRVSTASPILKPISPLSLDRSGSSGSSSRSKEASLDSRGSSACPAASDASRSAPILGHSGSMRLLGSVAAAAAASRQLSFSLSPRSSLKNDKT